MVTKIDSSSSDASSTPSGNSTSVAVAFSPTFNSEISKSNEEGMLVGNVEIVIVALTVCTKPPSSFTPIGVPTKLI